MIRQPLAHALRYLARRIHPQSDPPMDPHTLSAEDSQRLLRDLENVCGPEGADRRIRWAQRELDRMQPERSRNTGRSGSGIARADAQSPESIGLASEAAPDPSAVQNAFSEPLRASNRYPGKRGVEPTESAADHAKPNDYGYLTPTRLDPAITTRTLADRLRTDPDMRIRGLADPPDDPPATTCPGCGRMCAVPSNRTHCPYCGSSLERRNNFKQWRHEYMSHDWERIGAALFCRRCGIREPGIGKVCQRVWDAETGGHK